MAPQGMPASAEAVEVLEEWRIDIEPAPQPAADARAGRGGDADPGDDRAAPAGRACGVFPEAKGRVFLLKSFGTSRQGDDIADPIGLPVNVYRQVRDEIDAAISDLILYMMEHRGA